MADLDVAVIGAGIAGLAAAVAIRRAGHRATIYERSQFKNEVGAAVGMPSQSTRILQTWGVAGPNPTQDSPYKDMALGKLVHSNRRRPNMGEDVVGIISETPFLGDEHIYGAPYITYHRADLHSALRRVAEDAGANIVLGSPIVDLDCSNGTLVSADTTAAAVGKNTIQKDLIVIADGVNSSFVQHITGRDIPLLDTGRTAYRSLVETDKLLKDATAVKLFADGAEHCMNGSLDVHSRGFFIFYPCREGKLMNVAVFRPDKPGEKEKNDWDSPATVDEVLETINDFHPAYKAVIKHGEQKSYTVRARDPLPTYVNGRAIIIGDAAHGMFPTLAGGGSTALEDAAALGVLLSEVKPSDSTLLAKRLSLWNALRLPRDVVTQVLSTTMLQPKKASEFAEQLKHIYTGSLPNEILGGWTVATKKFVCPYDVFEVTRKALDWAEREEYPEDMLLRLQNEDVVRHFGS